MMQTDTSKLTRNQLLVLDALKRTDGHMSAYAILDHLRGEGIKAPLQVYRALDKLVSQGLVHKLESLNAFVACNHPECEDAETTVFTICEDCQLVTEVTDPKIAGDLQRLSKAAQFDMRKSTVELHGRCLDCSGQGHRGRSRLT